MRNNTESLAANAELKKRAQMKAKFPALAALQEMAYKPCTGLSPLELDAIGAVRNMLSLLGMYFEEGEVDEKRTLKILELMQRRIADHGDTQRRTALMEATNAIHSLK